MKKIYLLFILLSALCVSCEKDNQDKVKSIQLDVSELTLTAYDSYQFVPSHFPATAPTPKYQWHVDLGNSSDISQTGLYTPTGLGSGFVTLTAPNVLDSKGNPLTYKCKIEVSTLWAKKIQFKEKEITVKGGEYFTPEYILLPENSSLSNPITWSTSNPEIINVFQSHLRGFKSGKAEIYVNTERFDVVGDTCYVTVEPTPIEKLYFEDNGNPVDFYTLYLELGTSKKITPKYEPEYASYEYFTWSSTDPSVVSVNENGIITAHQTGTDIVSVTSNNGTKANIHVYAQTFHSFISLSTKDSQKSIVDFFQTGECTAIITNNSTKTIYLNSFHLRSSGSANDILTIDDSSVKGELKAGESRSVKISYIDVYLPTQYWEYTYDNKEYDISAYI